MQSVSQEVKVISDIQNNSMRAILPENTSKKRIIVKKGHSQKKVKGSQKHRRSSYHWSQLEQRKYLNYIIENRRRFEMPVREKKLKKIHSRLSQCIYSRNPTQCRTHHQKLLAKWGSIDGIIVAFRRLVSKKNQKRIGHLDEHESMRQQVKEEHINQIAPFKIIQSSNNVKEEENSGYELYQGRNHENHTGKSSNLETNLKQQINDIGPTELIASKQEAVRQQDQVNESSFLPHYQVYPINFSWNPYQLFWFSPNTYILNDTPNDF